jgi:hypothetical protein
MSNFRMLSPEEKVYVIYKDFNPARVIAVEKRGRKHYLLIRWENLGDGKRSPEKWVKDSLCTEYIPLGKETNLAELRKNALSVFPTYKANSKGKANLAWWQKLIVKLQNWWYGIDRD